MQCQSSQFQAQFHRKLINTKRRSRRHAVLAMGSPSQAFRLPSTKCKNNNTLVRACVRARRWMPIGTRATTRDTQLCIQNTQNTRQTKTQDTRQDTTLLFCSFSQSPRARGQEPAWLSDSHHVALFALASWRQTPPCDRTPNTCDEQ